MKRQTFLLILAFALFAGKAAAQCVTVGPVMSAICQGGTSAVLGGAIVGDATIAVWSDGGAGGSFSNNGGTTPGTATYTASLTSASPVTLTLTASGGTCTPTTVTKQIVVNPLPVPTITGVASACAGTTGVAYSTQGTMSGYSWTISAGGTITAGAGTDNVTVTWTTSGAQTISVNYTNGNSCTGASATIKNVTVNPLPVPTITGPATAAEGSSGNVYTTEASMTGYTWNIPAGGTITGGSTTSTATVTWNSLGARTITVTYTNGNSCTASSPTVYNVTVNANIKPVASNVTIFGDPKSGLTLYGSYVYSDPENDLQGTSLFQWYRGTSAGGADPAPIALATSDSYKIKDSDIGYFIGFSVRPVAATGTSPGDWVTSTIWRGPVTNTPPVATVGAITGLLNVNNTLICHYSYSDAEGDIEGASSYQWYSAPTEFGTYDPILNDTLLTHTIQMSEAGHWFKFSVKPRALTGLSPGTLKLSAKFGPANSKPQATGVSINGIVVVGNTINGVYTYFDADGNSEDLGATSFKWLRDGVPIPGETTINYLISEDDEGSKLRFQVIPVSSTGFPDTGDPFLSPETVAVPVTATLPAASQLCIDGRRANNEELTGKFYSTSNTSKFEFRWMRDNDTIPGETTIKYTLTSADLDHEIYFVVYPFSKSAARKRGLTVKSASLARIDLVKDTFFVTDKDTLLTGIPSNGVFYGDGIINGKFSPSSLDYTLSPFTINYLINIDNPNRTCSQIQSKSITVNGVTMYFDSFEPKYCQNGLNDTIYVKNIPAPFVPSGFNISGPYAIVSQNLSLPSPYVVLNPALMRPGNKLDIITFKASFFIPFPINFTSTIEISQSLIVDEVPPITIVNLIANSVICNNVPEYKLFGSPTGGTFSGPTIKNFDIFDPSAGNRTESVNYTKITGLGCISSITVPVTINPSPVVSFSVVDNCIESSTDITRFINSTSSIDPINKWEWEFSEAGGSSTSELMSPGYSYKTGGLHNVTLTATTTENCFTERTVTIDLGVKPVADFYWKNDCYHPNDSLMLFDTTYSPSFIVSRSWNFFDGDSLHVVKNPKYPKKTTGYLPVEYIVKTNYNGCHDTIKRNVYIRPTEVLGTKDYFWNFENGKGGWVKDYESRNSWSFGKPDRVNINSAASGDSAWFTRYDIDNQEIESSSIISPCFDFRNIERPMISMRLWKRFDLNRDGGALQYKIGDSKEWVYVGTIDDGINWYNSTLIKGKPGGEQIGWTAASGNVKDAAWTESKHKLDELVGSKDVKFRIAYGTDGTSQDNDGMAFDDIMIGRRTRGVLLEHFTNTTSSLGSTSTAVVSSRANQETKDIINIQYHTNFPGSDPYYNDNPGDASARLLFYGLSRVPYSFIDGGTRKSFANIYDYLNPDTARLGSELTNDLTRRSLISPSFSITLNTNVAGSILSVSGKVKASEPVNAENITLYLAVTEKKNSDHTGAQGETDFYNIFRKLIPDAGGISLPKIWAKNDSVTITERSWTIENIAGNSKIDVIAFIQNNITKEIYQAQVTPDTSKTVGIDKIFENNGRGFSLYPNPVSDRLTVEFEKPLKSETEIMIFDFKGALVRIYNAGYGQSVQTIPELGLKNGIYLVKIRSGGILWGSSKLIVANF